MARRNTKDAYKAAYLAEYEGYVRAGRDGDAKVVAGILRDSYGHDVDGGGKSERAEKTTRPSGKLETAAKPAPPENAAAEKPVDHVCDVRGCGFKAKTAAGLANHQRAHDDVQGGGGR